MKVTEIGHEKSRKHYSDNGYRLRASAEHEGYSGALTEKRITETDITNTGRKVERLLEEILEPENLNKAYKRVKRNKGSHGVDGMEVGKLLSYLKRPWKRTKAITTGREIPSESCKKSRNTKGWWKDKATRYTNGGRPNGTTSDTAKTV